MSAIQAPIDARREIGLGVKADFPIFERLINGKPLNYLDSAATTQKPHQVLDAMEEYFRLYNANIHRGIYTMAEEATARYEEARKKAATFINAASAKEILFVRNTTEGLNLVAQTWGRQNLKAGDEVLITEMEHHSNMVPWFILAQQLGFSVRYIPVLPGGLLDMAALPGLFNERTKLVSLTHTSNVLGTITPVKEIARLAHQAGALLVVDGAQSVPHMPVDVRDLDCDFLAFSGHKMLGPTGIGVLYGKRRILEDMPPFLGGGEMIHTVTYQGFTNNELPWKYEAGTPSIMEGIVLGTAIDYLSNLGMDAVRLHEEKLTAYAIERLSAMRGLTLYGPAPELRGGVVAFNVHKLHPHDVAAVLDQDGIAIRAGSHCAQPLHNKLGVPATARASFYVYNQPQDIDRLAASLERAQKLFGV